MYIFGIFGYTCIPRINGGWGGGFSKVVATFNHASSSLILSWPPPRRFLNNHIFSNLGLCAGCCAHHVCHHELWPTLMSPPFAGGKLYQKITIHIFRPILQNVAFRILLSFLNSLLSLLFLLTFVYVICYSSKWLYVSPANKLKIINTF